MELLKKNGYRSQKFGSILTSYIELEYLRRVKKIPNKEVGKWTKNKLISLGPTFIKIGQFMSTRTDIFGEEITNELKDLHDNVSPLNFKDVSKYIKPNIFQYVEETPIASASIGQVHRGKLITGEDIVLKIKRPNIEDQIIDDFQVLLFGLNILKTISEDRKIKEFEILFNEYFNLLKEEINFNLEANNMVKFKQNFSEKKWINIPKVYPELSDEDLIVMDYVPSIKINDIEKIDELKFNKERIAQKLTELFIQQVVDFGLVHIDPHPGNVGITEQGKLVFYDFGMILQLDPNIKSLFKNFLIAVYDKDVDAIATIAVNMGLITVDRKDIPYLKTFLVSFLAYIESADIEKFAEIYLDKIRNTPTPFVISSKFVLLLRGISILEGICKRLDKDFNFRKTLDPYVDQFIIDVNYFEARAIHDLKLLTLIPDKVQINQVQLEVLEKSIRTVEDDMRVVQKETYVSVLSLVLCLIMQHEYDAGIVTALFIGITYYFIINVKIYKQ